MTIARRRALLTLLALSLSSPLAAPAFADEPTVAGPPGAATKPAVANPIPADRDDSLSPLSPSPQKPSERGIAISAGFPLRYLGEEGAVSLAYGFGGHYAIRANVASYKARGNVLCLECEVSYSGRENDIGAGLVWYPRRLWSGPTLELGAFVRDREVGTYDHWAEYDRVYTSTDSTVIAARALLGWSWHWSPFFASVAAGFSVGHERGTMTLSDEMEEMVTVVPIRSGASSFETYFRVGFAFGL